MKARGVVPVDPFLGFPFDLANGFPRAEEAYDPGFEQPIVLSASALSYESPTLPTEGSIRLRPTVRYILWSDIVIPDPLPGRVLRSNAREGEWWIKLSASEGQLWQIA